MTSTATVTVLFCDVVGSTERLVRIGDVAGDALRRDLFGRLRRVVQANGGTEVKNLGDGLMVVFPTSVVAALACAREMHLAAAEVDPADPVLLRIGISVGEVAEEDGDWFGLPVVEAARLCAAAGGGRTLATALIRTLVGSRAVGLDIRDVGELTLKGLSGPLSAVELDWRDGDDVETRPTAPTGVSASVVSAPAGARTSTTSAPEPTGRREGRRLRSRKGRVAMVGTVAVVGVALLGLAVLGPFDGGAVPDVIADTSAVPSDAITEPQGYEPEFRATPCASETVAAVPDAECGELVVPESRADPGGSSLAVPVTKKAAAKDVGATPVVLIDVNEPLTTTSLTEVADVYALSLRGFSTAGPNLDCAELRDAWAETLSQRADDPTAIERRVDAAEACGRRLREEGVHLEGFNMAEVAQDIRDLVLAADLGRVAVVGGGFSSPAAVAFARANPGAVASLLLTNPVRPGSSPLGDPTASLASALARLAELCAEDAGCRTEHSDMVERYRETHDVLDDTPVEVVTNSLVGSGPHTVLLDGRRWAAALESALYQSGQLGLVPEAIASADDELIARTGIDEEVKGYIGPDARAGATLSYMCSYDASPNVTAAISATAAPEFAGANDATLQELCAVWGVPSVYDELSQPLFGELPTFLAQGALSVAGTNDWAGAMADQLVSPVVAKFATMSEDLSFTPPPCLRRLRNEFVVDPHASLDVPACEQQSPKIDFVGAA